MVMKKGLSFGALMVIILGVIFFSLINVNNHHSHQTQNSQRIAKKISSQKKTVTPLSRDELKQNRKLMFCSVIYFAVKHVKIQRWQEVSDFSLGWQIESHHTDNGTHYLVWPDKHITTNEKNLEPNWFEIKKDGRIIYHSFVVHSFHKNLTEATTKTKLIKQLNADKAGDKVRKMVNNLTMTHDN